MKGKRKEERNRKENSQKILKKRGKEDLCITIRKQITLNLASLLQQLIYLEAER